LTHESTIEFCYYDRLYYPSTLSLLDFQKMLTFSFKQTLFILLFSVCGLGLLIAVMTLPEPVINLPRLVDSQLATSGVSHPVTAILFNYRGYDTLLETAILLLALLSVWAVYYSENTLPKNRFTADFLSVVSLIRAILPIVILTSGYLLWAGDTLLGGAFQAGAVLSWVGIGLRLTNDLHPSANTAIGLRILLGGGLTVFISIAIGHHLFEYPIHSANLWIFIIESSLTLSFSLTLVMLFIGAPGITLTKSL